LSVYLTNQQGCVVIQRLALGETLERLAHIAQQNLSWLVRILLHGFGQSVVVELFFLGVYGLRNTVGIKQ